MDEFLKELGFEDQKEMNRLVSSVDLSTEENVDRFNNWKMTDGTKSGLLILIEANKKGLQSHRCV